MAGSPSRGSGKTIPLALVCSAVLHVVLVATGGPLGLRRIQEARVEPAAAASASVAAPSASAIDVELPAFEESSVGVAPGVPAPGQVPVLEPGGGPNAVPRPDTGRAGRGGTQEVSQPAVNLADRDDGLRLTSEVPSHLDRDQIQRVQSARKRESWEDLRRTTNPMELTFLASGKGQRMERRAPADSDPAPGQHLGGQATGKGSIRIGISIVQVGEGMARKEPGGQRLGSDHQSPGVGVSGGNIGGPRRDSADVAYARPMVDKGSPSVPSNASGSPKDTVDSAQEVAATIQSLVHASTAGGRAGTGPGGSVGPGLTGSGGEHGAGSRSQAMGQGGGGTGWGASDPRILMYRRRVLAKLYPLWENAFPRWAIAELRGGLVIISLQIQADGSLRNVFVKRPSGIAEFDANCLAAVKRAAPFEPLPPELGLSVMVWDINFDATNPAVR